MKKNLNQSRNKLVILTIFAILLFGSTGVFAQDPQGGISQVPVAQEQQAPDTNLIKEDVQKTIAQKNAYELSHMDKSGPKYIVFKFFGTMLGVLASALAIFLGLKIYKKFILKNGSKAENINYNNVLGSPKDFKEAINMFLDKTDK